MNPGNPIDLTINFMHALNLLIELTAADDIVIELEELSSSCDLWTRKCSQRMEAKIVND